MAKSPHNNNTAPSTCALLAPSQQIGPRPDHLHTNDTVTHLPVPRTPSPSPLAGSSLSSISSTSSLLPLDCLKPSSHTRHNNTKPPHPITHPPAHNPQASAPRSAAVAALAALAAVALRARHPRRKVRIAAHPTGRAAPTARERRLTTPRPLYILNLPGGEGALLKEVW